MRFTSGSGAECLMGATEGCSMLYLEARCLAVTRAAGSQGTQNGGIDGVNVAGSVPDGMREVIAENLLAMMHDLESCTGNDTLMSSSDIRRTAHTLPLLLAGSDFLFSGFGSIPAYDNAFGPSNFNAEDIDDYLVVQRDWGFEGVLRPQSDAELLPLRRRAVEALRAVLDELDLARFSDADAEAVVQAHGSLDVPALDPQLVPDAADQLMQRGLTALDVVRALAVRGFEVEAERVLDMLRQRLYGDYLQTSAIFTEDMRVLSALSDPNDYAGPGTGYRMTAARRVETGAVRQVWAPATLVAEQDAHAGCLRAARARAARRGTRPDEVVVGLSPAFAHTIWLSLSGLTVAEVLRQVLAGIEEEGASARLVQVRRTLDVGAIGSTASRLAGSGIGIGLQAKGTALIHRADLPPLGNLELFSIAPRVTRELYRGLGRNAARYARSAEPEPLFLAESSEPLGPNYHARVVALVALERGSVVAGRPGGGGGGMAELKPAYPLAESDAGEARTSSGRTRRARSRSTRSCAARSGPTTSASAPRCCGSRRTSPSRAATRSSPTTCAAAPSSSPSRTRSCSSSTSRCGPGARARSSWSSSPTGWRRAAPPCAPRSCARRAAPTCAAGSPPSAMLVAGVDVGNSTTELAVARLTPGAAPDFLGVWRAATTGAKGSTACAAGVSELVARAERRLGEPVHRLLLAELDPVDTGLVELGRLEELDLARNAVVRPVSETPSGAGAAGGRLRRLAELDGEPGPEAVLAIVLDEDFEDAAAALRAARERGHRIAGVIVQGDDAVLIGNRFDRGLPIVDEVPDAAILPSGALAALEVAVAGASVSELCDPLQLAELLRLGPDEARAARHAARAVAGRRTALVVREAGMAGSAAEAIDTTVRLLLADGTAAVLDEREAPPPPGSVTRAARSRGRTRAGARRVLVPPARAARGPGPAPAPAAPPRTRAGRARPRRFERPARGAGPAHARRRAGRVRGVERGRARRRHDAARGHDAVRDRHRRRHRRPAPRGPGRRHGRCRRARHAHLPGPAGRRTRRRGARQATPRRPRRDAVRAAPRGRLAQLPRRARAAGRARVTCACSPAGRRSRSRARSRPRSGAACAAAPSRP